MKPSSNRLHLVGKHPREFVDKIRSAERERLFNSEAIRQECERTFSKFRIFRNKPKFPRSYAYRRNYFLSPSLKPFPHVFMALGLTVLLLLLVPVMVWKCWNLWPVPVQRWWSIGFGGASLAWAMAHWRAELWKKR